MKRLTDFFHPPDPSSRVTPEDFAALWARIHAEPKETEHRTVSPKDYAELRRMGFVR